MRRPILVATLGVLLAATVPVQGRPAEGTLLTDTAPFVDGALTLTHSGELVLDRALAPDVPVALELAASRIVVERHWREWQVVSNPAGGPVRTATSDAQTETVTLTAATLSLGTLWPRALVALYPAEDSAATFTTAETARLLPLLAHADPLVVPGRPETRVEEGAAFSHRADGDRFVMPVGGETSAAGDLVLYAWDAEIATSGPDGDRTFRSGVESKGADAGSADAPTYTERREWLLVRLDDASGTWTVAADAASEGSPLVAFARAPLLDLSGSLLLPHASGSVTLGGSAVNFYAEDVLLEGTLRLEPAPAGSPRSTESPLAVGGEPAQEYPGVETPVSGDVTNFEIQDVAVRPSAPDRMSATAVAAAPLLLAVLLWFAWPAAKYGLLAPFVPLYAKIARHRILENEARERIYRLLVANPGLNLSAIHKTTGMGWGVTVYHLATLERNGLILSRTAGRDRCFFSSDARLGDSHEALMALSNRKPVRAIVAVVAVEPWIQQSEVVVRSGFPQRIVSYHLGKLAKQGLVERRQQKNSTRYRATPRLLAAVEIMNGNGHPLVPAPTVPLEEAAATNGASHAGAAKA